MVVAQHSRVLIIGSGPAGYTAAIYAARGRLEPVMIRGLQPGGQLTITTDVENFPGFEETVQGPWLMEQMEKQAVRFGTVMVDDIAQSVDFSRRPFIVNGDNGTNYRADAVIITTGASARWLGLASEERFKGFGVSACATCDAFFFRDEVVAIVGGGNTAVEEAIYLTKFASKVYVIHRRDTLRAEKMLQERLFSEKKIEMIWDSVVEEIHGTESPLSVDGVSLRNVITGAVTRLPVKGVFIAVGHTPNTEIFADYLDMDAEGYILTHPDSTRTNVPGVFAAGDVQDKVFRQAVTAAGAGCMAALEAEKYLMFDSAEIYARG